MRNLVSIEGGAPLNEELAQQCFEALPERARAFLDRLEEEADQDRASYEAQLQACNAYQAQLKEAEDRHDAFKQGVRDGNKEDVARLAVYVKRVTDARARLQAAESIAPAPANIDPTAILSSVFKAGLKEWRDLQVDPPDLGEGEHLQTRLKFFAGKLRSHKIAFGKSKARFCHWKKFNRPSTRMWLGLSRPANDISTRCTWDRKRLNTLTRLKIWTC